MSMVLSSKNVPRSHVLYPNVCTCMLIYVKDERLWDFFLISKYQCQLKQNKRLSLPAALPKMCNHVDVIGLFCGIFTPPLLLVLDS